MKIQLLLILFWSTACLAQELKAGHTSFTDLPAALEENLVESINLNEPFNLELFAKEQPVEQSFLTIWRSNRIDWSAKVQGLTLMFGSEMQASDRSSSLPDKEHSFGVKVSFDSEDKFVVVRSDSPASKKYLGGLRLTYRLDRSWLAILPGSQDRSLLVMIPRLALSSSMRTVVLCALPELKLSKSTPLPKAETLSKYKVLHASFEVSAHLLAKLQSGPGIGMARAQILTSTQIPASRPFEDQVFSHDPRVNIEYTADEHDSAISQPADRSNQVAGIRAQLELQNSAGYKRSSFNQELLWLRSFQPKKKFSATLEGASYELTPQSCALILKARQEQHSYSKEALLIPTVVPVSTQANSIN